MHQIILQTQTEQLETEMGGAGNRNGKMKKIANFEKTVRNFKEKFVSVFIFTFRNYRT